jgi:hypothetical protein
MTTIKKYNVPRDNAMADALDRQDGYGKYAPKKNDAISNKPMKSGGMLKRDDGGPVTPKKPLPPPPPKKTGMDAVKALGEYVSTFGYAKEKYNPAPSREGVKKMPESKMKKGGMLKRADGHYSKRGLWDNIRAAKGSGKKPTAQMLKQEKKIKAKTK